MLTDMVLEKWSRVLHLECNSNWSEIFGNIFSTYETWKPTSKVTHLLQQYHTYSSKATSLKNAILFLGGSFSFKPPQWCLKCFSCCSDKIPQKNQQFKDDGCAVNSLLEVKVCYDWEVKAIEANGKQFHCLCSLEAESSQCF